MKSEDTPICATELDQSADYRRVSLVIKRTIDITGASIGLVILSPVLLFIAILIKLDSPGPVIFSQTRLGLNCEPFTFYKFRSMRLNSDSAVHKRYIYELINGHSRPSTDLNGGKKAFKLTNDSRVTRVGRVLRRTSLDELPQLLNVLKGKMSLVGPRPAIPYEVQMYKDWYQRRMTVTPGMTGLWQVNGRSERSFDEMVKLDLEYIDNWSLLLDLKILYRTISAVLGRKGAW